MNIDVFANFDGNNLSLSLNLPFEFMDKNEKEYNLLESRIIFESDDLSIDYDCFFKQIDDLAEQIRNSFYNGKTINGKNKVKIHILEGENSKSAFEFIKKYRDLEVIYRANDFKEIIDNLKDEDYPNLKISFKNSDDNISYKEFYNMYCKLNEIVEFINHYNLSPLEKILLVYDIVKANEYKKENQGEDYGISRNLNEIIKNDKIVCVGFSNLIDFLLKNLGIKSNTIILGYKNEKVQHERNYIYLKDDKYNIDGMFFLDATWDSKKNNKYLDNYVCFLKPLNFFKRIKDDEYVVSPTKFKLLEKNKDELISYIKGLHDFDFIRFSVILSQLISEYNPNTSILFGLENKSPDEIIDLVLSVNKKYSKRIPVEAFKNALYRVRKIEYINGILKQEINEEYIDEVCDKYYKDSAEIKLLKVLNMYENPTLDKDLKVSNAKSTEEDLLRMRLLRAIKEKIDDKPENDYIKKM